MKGRQIVLGKLFGGEAAALLQDGQLIDLMLDGSALAPLVPGAICRGVVDRLVKGQGGVFLRLPNGARGYLRDRSGLREGQRLLVQVTGVAEAGKAIPVTANPLFRGRYGIVTPNRPGVNISRSIRDDDTREALAGLGAGLMADADPDCGLIMRSAAAGAEADEISAELGPLIALSHDILAETEGAPELLLDAASPHESAWMDWAEPAPDQVDEGDDSFDRLGVSDLIDTLLSPEISLPGGATACVEPTRALVAIDVNTGRDVTPAAGLKANVALARDLPRQLRLRGLGGQVVVDFAPMPKRDRATLDQVLKSAFKKETAETVLIGWTKMGLYELSRKRDRAPLAALAQGRGA